MKDGHPKVEGAIIVDHMQNESIVLSKLENCAHHVFVRSPISRIHAFGSSSSYFSNLLLLMLQVHLLMMLL